MLPTLPQGRAPRPARWRMALLSGLAVAAVAGSTLLVLPQAHVEAQSRAQVIPPGAPASFADLVEHVKPAVVSIQVTGQGPKIARLPQDPKGRPTPRDPGARPPSP